MPQEVIRARCQPALPPKTGDGFIHKVVKRHCHTDHSLLESEVAMVGDFRHGTQAGRYPQLDLIMSNIEASLLQNLSLGKSVPVCDDIVSPEGAFERSQL